MHSTVHSGWVKTRGTLVIKDGQTVEKPTVTG